MGGSGNLHTVGTGDGGELVAVGTAWSQDGESNFLVSGFREGQGHSHPAGEVVSSALTPHSLFLSYKRARRAQCVLPRDEERWARQPELSNGAGRTGWDRGVGGWGGAVPQGFRTHKHRSKSVANPSIESVSQLLPWCM